MSKRTSMLGSTVREIIAPILRECPQECGIVSIVRVEVSSDFSYATVYVSALRNPEKALEFLQSRVHQMQKGLGSLHRKKIPMLRFRIDRQGEKDMRIDALLDEAARERKEL